jgi:zinc D-Ala-D-Ala carboxypeptidase
MSVRVSEHFLLKELVYSDTAKRLGIDNTPNLEHMAAMGVLCDRILEPCRVHFDKPIKPSSCYRSPALCQAIGSNGSTSQHTRGQAVDFEIFGMDNFALATWIIENLEFDQIILEGYDPADGPNSGWVHCSYNNLGVQRKNVLHTQDFKTYVEGLPNA